MAEIVILGAGLTGLSAAYHLEQQNCSDYVLFEKDATVGGLRRTVQQDGFTFDYTGHLLHINDPYFQQLIYQLLAPEQFNQISRRSYIYSQERYTKYPFQVNIYGLPVQTIIECIQGYLQRPIHSRTDTFYQWAQANFGAGITKYFLAPYQRKIFAYDIHKLSASWTGRFVPATSLSQMLAGALSDQNPSAQQIGYNANFVYPKQGGIFAWVQALYQQIKQPVQLNYQAQTIDLVRRQVRFTNGHIEPFKQLISTIPLDHLLTNLREPSNLNLRTQAKKLRCNSVINFNLGVNRPDLSDKHWIYFPEPQFAFYRLGFPHNFTKYATPPNCSSLYGEFAYLRASKKAVQAQLQQALVDTKKLLQISAAEILTEKIIQIPHAYVIYNHWRDTNLPTILTRLAAQGIDSCGRYGAWKYASMQEAILDGKLAAEKVT
ncbi:MAG TPA: FAD-dependent oxidoreductase [Candidatus Babeliales bacterium]|nr:FAD-dependent oxidoreductase [Candidatus Babeliales bacterium]